MSEKPPKLLIADFVEPVELGGVIDTHRVEHITYAPPAQADSVENAINAINAIRSVTSSIRPWEVKTTGFALFGDNNDVLVSTLELHQRHKEVHDAIIEVLRTLHFLFDDNYTGKNYRPHISSVDIDPGHIGVSRPGVVLPMTGLSVARKTNSGSWVVIDKIHFKGDDEQ